LPVIWDVTVWLVLPQISMLKHHQHAWEQWPILYWCAVCC